MTFTEPPRDVCSPSPCGPNSQCRDVNNHAVCSCISGYVGSPPNCRPECVVSSDCPQNQACVNQRCRDPCPGTCGIDAICQVVNHNPICSCPPSYEGDPFIRCQISSELRKMCNKRLRWGRWKSLLLFIFTNFRTCTTRTYWSLSTVPLRTLCWMPCGWKRPLLFVSGNLRRCATKL